MQINSFECPCFWEIGKDFKLLISTADFKIGYADNFSMESDFENDPGQQAKNLFRFIQRRS